MHDTQKKILLAARAVLASEGSNGFSFRKVAEASGISLSNVQYHFKTRDALLSGLFAGFVEEYRSELLRFLVWQGGGKEALLAFVREVLADEAKNDEVRFFRSLFTFAEPDVLGKQLEKFYEDVHTLLCELIARLSGQLVNSPRVVSAVALVLPYLNGFGQVSSSLHLDIEQSAVLLTSLAWQIVSA